MHNQPDQQAALLWQAYLYAADQMPEGERAAFEERLDADQGAREVLARVVRLTQAISSLPAEAFSPSIASTSVNTVVLPEHRDIRTPTTWRQPAAWMAIGAAACWLLIAVFGSLDRFHSGRSDSASRPLVLAWSEYSNIAVQPEAGDGDDNTNDDRAARPRETASDVEPDFAAPDWLVLALNPPDEEGAATTDFPVDGLEPDGGQPAEEQ